MSKLTGWVKNFIAQCFIHRSRSKMQQIANPYLSSDAFIWTDKEPDFELIEPEILVSINRNFLRFGRKIGRPSVSHQMTIVNHGDFPVAFKIHTTDNCAYYVNQVYGVIPGRRLHCLPHVRMPNSFQLVVSRKPYDTFPEEIQTTKFNIPRKDRLFIYLAPVMSFSIPPASVFHNGAAHEKLRVCLDYTGSPHEEHDDQSLLHRKVKGWCTWAITAEELAEHMKNHPTTTLHPAELRRPSGEVRKSQTPPPTPKNDVEMKEGDKAKSTMKQSDDVRDGKTPSKSRAGAVKASMEVKETEKTKKE